MFYVVVIMFLVLNRCIVRLFALDTFSKLVLQILRALRGVLLLILK